MVRRLVALALGCLAALPLVAAPASAAARPAVVVTARPAADALARGARVAWTTRGRATRVTCSLDGAAARRCASPRRLRGLAPGRHVLVVRAVGPGGSTRAVVRWRVLRQRILWGAWIDGAEYGFPTNPPWDTRPVDAFERHAGKRASILFFGVPWSAQGEPQEFDAALFERVRRRGSIPMVDWLPWEVEARASRDQPAFRLARIIDGTYDGYIRAWATAARDWGHPLFLRFAHEMNGTWMPWSERVNGNRKGEYVRAWRHVRGIFDRVGATSVTWVWAPNQEYAGSQPLAGLYPGDRWVDWVGMDGYNWGLYPDRAGWVSFESLFAGLYRRLGRLAPTKPVMVAETAANESGGSKAAWIRRALLRTLPDRFPRVRAFVWFNWAELPGLEWPIASTPASRRAFRQGIGIPYYAANGFRTLPPGPVRPLPTTA